MAETDQQADTPQEAEAAAPKAKTNTRRRPTKKRTAKKPAKKPVKKTRAKRKNESNDKSSASRLPKKRTSKKPAKKTAKNKDEGRVVISSPPRRRDAKKPAAQEEAKETASAEQSVSQGGGETSQEDASGMQWGRRSKRSGPIGWEEHVGASAQPTRRQDSETSDLPAEVQAESQPAVESPAEAQAETPVQEPEAVAQPEQASENKRKSSRADREDSNRSRSKKTDQDNRRSSRRNNDRGRNNHSRSKKTDQDNRRSDRDRKQKEKSETDKPSRKLAEILAQSWTEDKTRRFLSEGFLSSLSPELISNGNEEPIPDTEALKEPLQMIRKVLADECMVADDVTDLILLDVVINALSDRIEVCRLQAESQSLADMDVILDLRYKADRRLIEAVNALKNA